MHLNKLSPVFSDQTLQIKKMYDDFWSTVQTLPPASFDENKQTTITKQTPN